MPEQKSFWKKYEWIIIAIATLLFIYFVVFFNQKINFFLGNELIVYLTPHQQSFSMHYGDTSKAQFDVSIDNAAYCKAACSYSFNDRSASEVVEKGDFEIQKGQHFAKEYELSVKRLGSGQDIYSFEVSCRSIKSFLCLTRGDEKSRSSFITVNYDLTETEKELKKILKQNVTGLLELLSEADVSHQQLNQKYFELGFRINLKNLTKEKIGIDDLYDKMRISIENLRSLWAVENYIELNKLFNGSFFEALYSVKKSIDNMDKKIDGFAALHNKLLSDLNGLSANLSQLSSFANILGDNESELFFSSDYYLKYENDLLCMLKQNCNENISILNGIKNTEKFIEEYPNDGSMKQNCNSLRALSQEYSGIRNETLEMISNKNIAFPSDSGFLALADNFKNNEIRKINNSYLYSFEKIKSENKTDSMVIGIAEALLPTYKTEMELLAYNESINITLYLLSKISLSDETLQLIKECKKTDMPSQIGNFDFEPISLNITYNIISKIDTNLSDNPPICCVFSECKPCCRDDSCKNDQKTFPIIFLHGHSLAKGNSPEFSLDSFNKLQSKLQDDGYLNSGIVSLYSKNEMTQQGIWGLSGKPVTVKASYYYDAFRQEDKYIVVPTKSENIDTYAVRLKEIIDIVKQRTNKPKVNIIAHSMGGLVARRYMQIFGDNDIDKLIVIATPNKGISGAASDYCGLVGENRECQDMQENSLFINKLNDPLKQPVKARLYAIIGQGCQMGQDNGDGVVLAESAKLKDTNLYYVNGTCGGIFGESLHTEILNIDKYPETYSIIKGILKE
ncbi:alpha/beta fold hydrolase [Candidatus Woesearchaeota archaeon]|nr:alpha/beta fold hydrolase [Candidatus Woesearchaeota archaeon]